MSELVTLSDAKGYLRDVPKEEDRTLNILLTAAISFCETKLKRPLRAEKMTTETQWDIPEEINVAILMLVAHWYDNRSAVGTVEGEIAFSVNALVNPHKFHSFGGG